MSNKFKMSMSELKVWLHKNNIEVRPSYCHDDYRLTSISMPYPVKDKLDFLAKKYNMTRSSLVCLLIQGME